MRFRFLLAPALLALLAATGCGSSSSSSPSASVGDSVVAEANGPVAVFAAPDASAPSQTLAATLPSGGPLVMLATSVSGQRVQVLLPQRPNGSSGWVDQSAVTLTKTDLALDVNLTTRQLTETKSGRVVLVTPVAVGAPATPTPAGQFFLADLLRPTIPDGAYGPFAFGLSGFSDVLTSFAGGDGQAGLHGTNDPSSIGQPVTHGCLRVSNDTITQFSTALGLGTPVSVHF